MALQKFTLVAAAAGIGGVAAPAAFTAVGFGAAGSIYAGLQSCGMTGALIANVQNSLRIR
jgi:hypothetical protein